MSKRLSKPILVWLMLCASQLFAGEQVRILSNLDDVSTSLYVTQKGTSGVDIAVEVPAVAISTVTLENKDYKRIDLPNADKMTSGELAEDGRPDIPIWTTMLAIPGQAGVNVSVTYSGYDVIEDIEMAPVQPSKLESHPEVEVPFTLDHDVYGKDEYYPGKLADAAEPVIMRDIRGVQISLYPVQYNPVRREARVYRDLAVSVSYGGEAINPKTTHRNYLSDGFYPLYKSMFANFDDIYSNTEVRRGGYVIICKPTLADTMKALALWKHKKGYHVRIVPTTEIHSSGTPSASQVLNFLINAYNNWEIPPEYVMIVGDRDNTSSTGIVDYPYSGYPSDHHYTRLEGTDYLPEIFLARMSIDNVTELRRAIAKVFKYENKPQMFNPQHWVKGLSVAYTYYESSRLVVLWVRQLMLQHGFIQVDTVCTQGSDGRLSGFMRNGPAYIQYRGAGSTDGWWGPSWTTSDLLAQPNNQKLGIMAPLTCGLGDFGAECFGETWIRMGFSPDSLKGGPAFYGVSDHNTHTRWNNPIMIGYYFGIFVENVTHFAAAAVRGKLQQYRTFPSYRGPGQYVEQYFNTYNMLGDPELELRTAIPILLTVTHEDTVAFGLNHIEVNVIDTAGNAIKDAFVTLIKGVDANEEVFSVGKTDDLGNVSLSFDAETIGSMWLTVSGTNLYPYEGTVEIINSDLAVGFDSLVIDDDLNGYSHGNGDSVAAPNETIELGVSLKNFGVGSTAQNISTTLEPIDEDVVFIYDASRDYGDLAPGESRMTDRPYLVHVSPKAEDGDLIRLKQTATDLNDSSWYSVIELPVIAPKFGVASVSVLDGNNNRLDPGDTVSLVVKLFNGGAINASGITGILTTTDDYTTIISPNAYFENIPVGDTADNTDTPLRITVDSGTFEGKTINFVLRTTTAAGSQLDIPFTVSVGAIGGNDPVGPDAYGYYMYDIADTNYAPRPTYNWVELYPGAGGHGTRLTFGGVTDDKSTLVMLPFNMKYYGEEHGALIVCINGFAALDTFRFDMGGNFWHNFFNWPIPDPGNAQGQISPFWDDLQFSGSNYGVYTWFDSTNHLFYIEWYHMTHRNTSQIETFQMVITDPAYTPTLTGDSEIYFYYNDINNTDSEENYATVGFESWDELRGLEYTHDNRNDPGAINLADSRAIRITTNTGRGGIKGVVDLHNGGSNAEAAVTTSSGQHRTTSESGEYWLRNVPPGYVNLTFTSHGYFPHTLDSVEVVADRITNDINASLDSCLIPTGLTATDTLPDRVILNWSPISHPNFAGYYIYRSRWENGEFTRLNLNPVTETSYTDLLLPDSSTYWYCVAAVYSNNIWVTESFGSEKDGGRAFNITGIAETPQIPGSFFLAQNYPNPFNPTTSISFGLPGESDVRVEVFNLLGQKVRTLLKGHEKAGYKTIIWDGTDEHGKAVSSGIYLYKIEAGKYSESRKMTLLK